MDIVVNEWLLDYMRPDAEHPQKVLASKFVNAWVERCHKILIRRPSPFVSKFYKYHKLFGWDQDFKERFKKINLLLFHNPDKTKILDDNDVTALPKELRSKTHHKDIYLIELAYCSADRIVVTTDEDLKKSLKDEGELRIYLPDEFLAEFSRQD